MNPDLEKQMAEADAAMKATGETQPPEDGRAATSPANGAKGGRPQVDYGELSRAFQMARGIVQWTKGEFYHFDEKRGAYSRRTEKEMGAAVGNWLKDGGGGILYTVNAERNIMGALRATYNPSLPPPPCFADTGKSAAGFVAMSNGLLDIEAAARGEPGALQAHTHLFFSTNALPYEWNPDAHCPRFARFVEEVQPDSEGREALQMLAGLLLVPDTSYNVFFILTGEGGCGKSTFLKILIAMLGEENVCAVPLSMMQEKHTTHRLTRCLANLVDDSPTVDGKGQSLAGVEGILKQITGGALIHVEPKGVDPWEAPATARCVFCVNPPLPPFVDRPEALWDRLRVIPFPMRFRGTAQENPRLLHEILAAEKPGIFAWAVEGLGKLRKLPRFPQTAAGAAIVEEHRGTCDREKAFLADRYTYSSGAFTPSGVIYAEYRAWCEAEGIRNVKSASRFSQDVARVFPQVKYANIRRGGQRVRGFSDLAGVSDLGFEETPDEI